MAASIPRPAGPPLEAASWAQTPLVVRHLILQLLVVIQQLQTTIQHLQARIKTLKARIAALEARLQRRSSNSDRPPSSDPPYAKRPARSNTQGKPGAKPGHPGYRQVLLAPTEVIEVRPAPLCLWATGVPRHAPVLYAPSHRVAGDSDGGEARELTQGSLSPVWPQPQS